MRLASLAFSALAVAALVPNQASVQRAPAVDIFTQCVQISRTASGSVAGYGTRDYALTARAGDHVSITLNPANRHLYFMRNDARRGAHARFTLTIAMTCAAK